MKSLRYGFASIPYELFLLIISWALGENVIDQLNKSPLDQLASFDFDMPINAHYCSNLFHFDVFDHAKWLLE